MDWRERLALEHLLSGLIEHKLSFPARVGDKTLKKLCAKGWIEHVFDRETGEEGYRITDAGRAAYERG